MTHLTLFLIKLLIITLAKMKYKLDKGTCKDFVHNGSFLEAVGPGNNQLNIKIKMNFR